MIIPLFPFNEPSLAARGNLQYPFSQPERAGVIITAICSIISLSCVTILLCHVVYMAIRPFLQRRFGICGGPQFLRVHFSVFIVCLFTSDLLQAVSGMIQIRWVQWGGINEDWACTMQGALLHVGNVGTAVWTTVVAIHTFVSIVLAKELPRWVVTATVITGWLIIALIALIGPVMIPHGAGPFYGIAGSWCFVVDPFQRIVLHYVELFISAFTILVLYILVFLKLRGHLLVDGGRWSFSRKKLSDVRARSGASEVKLDSLAKKMLWYPIVYFTLIIPISICRLASFAGIAVPIGAWLFAMCFLFLMGAANALVYTLTRSMGLSHAWKPISKNIISSSQSVVAMQIVVDKETTTDVKYIDLGLPPQRARGMPRLPSSRREMPIESSSRGIDPRPLQARNPDAIRESLFAKEAPEPTPPGTPLKTAEEIPSPAPAVLKLPRAPSPVNTLFRDSRVTLAPPTRPPTPPPAYIDDPSLGPSNGSRASGSYPPEKGIAMRLPRRPSTSSSVPPPTPTLVSRLSIDEKPDLPSTPRSALTSYITSPTISSIGTPTSAIYPPEKRSAMREPRRPSTTSSIPPTPTLPPRPSIDNGREPVSPSYYQPRVTTSPKAPAPPLQPSSHGEPGAGSPRSPEKRGILRPPRRPSTTSSITPTMPAQHSPSSTDEQATSLSSIRHELTDPLSTAPPRSRHAIIFNPPSAYSHGRSASSGSVYPSHTAESSGPVAQPGVSTHRHGSASAVTPSRPGRRDRPPHTAPSRSVGKSFLDLDMQ